MVKNFDIVMAGVGGQGTILASNILSDVGLELGYHVKKSEVHGMAQRGGTVESHVRWGQNVAAPLVEQNKADFLLGFEMLETARWPMYIKEGTVVIVNNYRIPPPTVNTGQAVYPTEQEVESILSSVGGKVKWIAATQIAADLGNPAMVGVVLLGGDESVWLKVVESMVPEKFQDMNKQAFLQGRAASIA